MHDPVGRTTIDDLIEALPAGVLLATDAGVIVRVNAAAERLFGRDRAALIGTPLDGLVPITDVRASEMIHTTLRHSDGTAFDASVGVGRLDGGSHGLLVVTIAAPLPHERAGPRRAEAASRAARGRLKVGSPPDTGADIRRSPGALDRPPPPSASAPASIGDLAGHSAEPSMPTHPAAGVVRSEHVMYVDDEEAIVLVAKRRLGRLGYQVSGYTDVKQALDDFRAQPDAYDVVVTDVAMPGMSGFEFGRAVKALRAGTPLLMTSGFAGPEDQQLARDLGAVDFIQKPHTVVELERALDQVFAQRRGSVPPAGP